MHIQKHYRENGILVESCKGGEENYSVSFVGANGMEYTVELEEPYSGSLAEVLKKEENFLKNRIKAAQQTRKIIRKRLKSSIVIQK